MNSWVRLPVDDDWTWSRQRVQPDNGSTVYAPLPIYFPFPLPLPPVELLYVQKKQLVPPASSMLEKATGPVSIQPKVAGADLQDPV